jgi:hypothetical protein
MKQKHVQLTPEDAWRVYELLEQMNSFLHQPENYADPVRVTEWLGSGVYAELRDLLYGIGTSWFDIDEETSSVLPPPGVKRRFPEP